MGYVGCHLSISDGYVSMAETAERIGAGTFAFFIRNPRGGNSRKPSKEEIAAFNHATEKFAPLVVHGAYTMNLCSDKEDVRNKAVKLDRTSRNLQQYLTKSDVKRKLVSVLIHATCGMLGMISGITLTVSLMCLTMQSGLTSLRL